MPPVDTWNDALKSVKESVESAQRREMHEIESRRPAVMSLIEKTGGIQKELADLWRIQQVLPTAKRDYEAKAKEEENVILETIAEVDGILKIYAAIFNQVVGSLNTLNALDSKRLPVARRLPFINLRKTSRQLAEAGLLDLETNTTDWEYIIKNRKAHYYGKVNLPKAQKRLADAKNNPNDSGELDKAQSVFVEAYNQAATEVIFIKDQTAINPSVFGAGEIKVEERDRKAMILDLKSMAEDAIEIGQKHFDNLVHRVSEGETQASMFEAITQQLEMLAKYQSHLIALGEPEETHAAERSHLKNLAVAYQMRALRAKVAEIVKDVADPKVQKQMQEAATHFHAELKNLESAFVRYDLANMGEGKERAASNSSEPSLEERKVVRKALAEMYADLFFQYNMFKKKSSEPNVKALCENVMNDATRLEQSIEDSLAQLGKMPDIDRKSRARILQGYIEGEFGVWKDEPPISKRVEKLAIHEEGVAAEGPISEDLSSQDVTSAQVASQGASSSDEKKIASWKKDIDAAKAQLSDARKAVTGTEAKYNIDPKRKTIARPQDHTSKQLKYYADEVAKKADRVQELCSRLTSRYRSLVQAKDDVQRNEKFIKQYETEQRQYKKTADSYRELGDQWEAKRKKEEVAERPTYTECEKYFNNGEIKSVTSEKLPFANIKVDEKGKRETDNKGRGLYDHVVEYLITLKGGAEIAVHLHFDSHKTADEVTKEELLEGKEGKLTACVLKAGKDKLKGRTYQEQQALLGRNVEIYHCEIIKPDVIRTLRKTLEHFDVGGGLGGGRGGRH